MTRLSFHVPPAPKTGGGGAGKERPDIELGGCSTQCLPCKSTNTGSTLAPSSDFFARNQPHYPKHPSSPISIPYKTLPPLQEAQTAGESFHSYPVSGPHSILGFTPVLCLGSQARGRRCGAGRSARESALFSVEHITCSKKTDTFSSFPNLREAPLQIIIIKITQYLCFWS